ncbi:protein ImuB [Sphingomonas zeicaulis]|uniref:Y-family DNA polymerase n=1 Tax=Sphingomonas zeicaulis TaxID=1632740 RepID=UPI003D247E25
MPVSSAKRPEPRRCLALWFPFLSADRLSLCRPEQRAGTLGLPFAFVEKVKGGLRLAALDTQALSLGLGPGMTLADARARVPELAAFDHDPHADQDWLERLADGCLRYTPLVALDEHDGLTLDVTGCAHLFGGEAALAGDIVRRLDRSGIVVRHGYAASPDAAQALARWQTRAAPDEAEAVRALPVAALRIDEDSITALKRAGLKTVGEVLRRPMATIAARFGADAVDALRRLSGESANPLKPRRAMPALGFEKRFAEPLGSTAHALAVLRALAGEAAQALEERREGGRGFVATFFRSDGLTRSLFVQSGLPTRDPAAIMRLFNERVDSLSDPIDPGFGFDMIAFAVPEVEPLASGQLKLEGGETASAEVDALVDRLTVRHGRTRLVRLVPSDTHIPEQAQLPLPAAEADMSASWPQGEADEPPLRPIHLFDPPQRIDAVLSEVPDGPPMRFRWRRALHEIRRFEGPERIASEWWRRKDGHEPGKGGLTRDYYRVEDARGRRLWVFRHGLAGSERENPDWYVHGLFA